MRSRVLLAILPLAVVAALVPAPAGAQHIRAEDYSPSRFGPDSANVDNRYSPFTPGTRLTYRGATTVDGERERHRVITIVTDLTKVIDGVRNVVVWERDFSGGRLVEAELAFFAQDRDGNVWHFGQYPEEYEDGRFVAAPAWIATLRGAKAGVFMQARPRLGEPSYAQGLGPEVDWRDRARVFAMGRRTCVPVRCYRNVLVTDEFTPDEPGAHQLKYYARGVGNVRVGFRGRDPEQEVLVLADLDRLSVGAVVHARRAALELERRAYTRTRNVYRQTPPLEHTLRVRR